MKIKICATCKLFKLEENFNWKDKEHGLRGYVCKTCHALYRKEHYADNRTKYIQKALRWNKNQKEKLRNLISAYLKEHPCVDCGEGDIIVLDFDHRSDKRLTISQMFSYSYSVEQIQKEIEKCEVRCANCHRRRTAREGRYWRVRYSV